MKSFEYARPTTEAEAVAFLGAEGIQTAILAGGTDLTSPHDYSPRRRDSDWCALHPR